jgi:hypothetical protein
VRRGDLDRWRDGEADDAGAGWRLVGELDGVAGAVTAPGLDRGGEGGAEMRQDVLVFGQ